LTTKTFKLKYARFYRNLPIPLLSISLWLAPPRSANSVKIPFPTNMPTTKRPKVADPSSVVHFSNSDRDDDALAVEPCIVPGRSRTRKCRCPVHFPPATPSNSSFVAGPNITHFERAVQGVGHRFCTVPSPLRASKATECGEGAERAGTGGCSARRQIISRRAAPGEMVHETRNGGPVVPAGSAASSIRLRLARP
jgi:hypothetical protein